MTDLDPRFPPEIEYEIFILAFHNDPKGQTVLLRVAKRVLEWILPLLYNALMVTDEFMKFKVPPSQTLKKYGHLVRHLFVMPTMRRRAESSGLVTLSYLAPLCPNVANLAVWFGGVPTPDILDLPVRRLAMARFGFLEDRFNDDPNEVQLTRWCSNITHLAIGQSLDGGDKRYLAHFPALEYLMIFLGNDKHGFIEEALQRCRRLKAVIQLLGPVSDYSKTQVAKLDQDEHEDVRVVKVDGYFVGDWHRGIQGLGDLWDVAANEVERRRRISSTLAG